MLDITAPDYRWNVHLLQHGAPAPYWLTIDDVTGRAEFTLPIVQLEQRPVPDAGWLRQIDETVRTAVFPIAIELLLRYPALANAKPSGGGSTGNGRAFLEYTLRQESGSPARFELRCYHVVSPAAAEPIIVTHAELAYVDAGLNRWRRFHEEP